MKGTQKLLNKHAVGEIRRLCCLQQEGSVQFPHFDLMRKVLISKGVTITFITLANITKL